MQGEVSRMRINIETTVEIYPSWFRDWYHEKYGPRRITDSQVREGVKHFAEVLIRQWVKEMAYNSEECKSAEDREIVDNTIEHWNSLAKAKRA
jgi:hypothetical protein